jgi:hypothetical protein
MTAEAVEQTLADFQQRANTALAPGANAEADVDAVRVRVAEVLSAARDVLKLGRDFQAAAAETSAGAAQDYVTAQTKLGRVMAQWLWDAQQSRPAAREGLVGAGARVLSALRDYRRAIGIDAALRPANSGGTVAPDGANAESAISAAAGRGAGSTIPNPGPDGAAVLSPSEIKTLPLAEIEQRLPRAHPSAYYEYAARLFNEGRKDDAVVWFYVGQLRYRFLLLANPGQDPARFAALQASVGEMINPYVAADRSKWAAQLGQALAWDEANPNGVTAKETHADAWQTVRAALAKLKASIEAESRKSPGERPAGAAERR